MSGNSRVQFGKKNSKNSSNSTLKPIVSDKPEQNSFMMTMTRKKSKPEQDDPLTHLVNTFDKRAD